MPRYYDGPDDRRDESKPTIPCRRCGEDVFEEEDETPNYCGQCAEGRHIVRQQTQDLITELEEVLADRNGACFDALEHIGVSALLAQARSVFATLDAADPQPPAVGPVGGPQ